MLRPLYQALLYLALGGLSLPGLAQQYSYVQYHSGSDAPFDRVSTVVQDEAGFIWIGSQNGLYRFDGVHFDMYSVHTESQFIHQLHQRGDHLLFVNDIGIYRIDSLSAQPEVTPVLEGTINETDSLPFYPNDFILGADRSIWLSQSNHSIGRLRDGEFQTYDFSPAGKEQHLAIQEDNSGGIWALSPLDGLFYFDLAAATFTQKLSITNGRSMVIHDDYLLLGSEVLRIYRIQDHRPRLIRTIELGQDDLITALYVDGKDQYFIGTQGGQLYTLADINQPLQPIYGANEAHRVEELDFGPIHEIYVTTDSIYNHDQLWVGAETGLWLLQQRFFRTVKNLPMVNPIAIALGRDGKAWLPINYVYEVSPQGDGFTAQPILDGLQVTAVTQDRAGSLWVAMSTPRVELRQYRDDKVVRRYEEFHERGEAIFNLYPDSKGNLWFCQAPLNKPIVGVAMITATGAIRYYDETKGFSSRVLSIKEGARGEIYAAGIGETSYLYRYDPAADRFVNLSPPLPFTAMLNFEAHDLTIDDRGVVWLATTDGLLRYDGEKITLIQNDILRQEEVRGVTHYANNNIWIATATKGLVFYQGNTATALGETEGLPAIIGTYRCIATDAEGRLWAGTAEGLVYSRMSAATLPNSHPPRIRTITIDRKEYTEGWEEGLSLQQDEQLLLNFMNLSFPAKNVQYQYRLLLEEDRAVTLGEQLWQPIENQNELELSELELGDYYLELRARQPGGYQWSEPIDVQFRVFQPWYRQSWLLYGSIGLLLLLVAYYSRFYVRHRFSRLQRILQYSHEKLAEKESQLHEKIQEVAEQQEELDHANLNIQTLELFIKEIPRKASWAAIITAMGRAVNQSADVNAFEIAFKEEDEIVHKGYSDQERSGYTFRSKPFNSKTSLTCWAMANETEVLINDFDREHTQYIDEKAAYRFKSLLFIPFELETEQPVVLCAYSIEKDHFDTNDLIMFRVLARFIYFAIHEEIKKVV